MIGWGQFAYSGCKKKSLGHWPGLPHQCQAAQVLDLQPAWTEGFLPQLNLSGLYLSGLLSLQMLANVPDIKQ